jgi:hypothetical protein
MDTDLFLNLGTGQPESRSASFGGAILASHPGAVLGSEGLAEASQRYDAVLARSYRQAGVMQLTENAKSAVSLGLSPSDPRSGVFQGRRYLMTASNGRSQSTSEAAPVLQEDA